MRASLALLLLLLGCAAAPPAPTYREPAATDTGALALIGDMQRTLAAERLLGREQNDAERAALVADLSAQRPRLVVLLGDMTSAGGSRSNWDDFDALAAPLREAGIAVLAVLGNHDYWSGYEDALANAGARFPQLARSRWYARRWGRLALVMLDSNDAPLGEQRWAEQRGWYERTLLDLDGDSSVSGVLVLAHHPPLTNSRTTGDEERVRQAFLPAFLTSRKALAFITGHAHAYERFEEEGKAFVVSGGGGGPRVLLLAGAEQRHHDLFAGPSPRPFHYLLVTQDAAGARVAVRGLDKGEARAREIDSFALPFK